MAAQYVVRQGRRKDMLGMLRLVEDEGWSNVLQHLEILFDMFAEGIIVAESPEGEIISFCSSVTLDNYNGQVTFYITKKSYRGQGIGRQVFDRSMKTLGNRNVAINALWDKVDMYASVHFKITAMTLLFHEFPVGNFLPTSSKESSCKMVDIKEINFDRILAYDRIIHPIPREKVLKWALGFAEAGRVAVDGDEIKGWGTVHKSSRGYRLMPLYADTPELAEVLATELLKPVAGDPKATIQSSFREDNKNAAKLYSNLGFCGGECMYTKRMFTERDISVPSHSVYSILSEKISLA